MVVNRKRFSTDDIQIASFGRPYPGERVSGDGVVISQRGTLVLLALIDALGHGHPAHAVARTAERYLQQAQATKLADVLNGLHHTLQGSIGAAIGLGLLDATDGSFHYLGVGNIVARTFGSREKRLVSVEGIVGAHWRQPPAQTLRLQAGDLLLFYSDGVSDRFGLADYPQLPSHGPAAVARTVVERFGKGHDDATCLALKIRAERRLESTLMSL